MGANLMVEDLAFTNSGNRRGWLSRIDKDSKEARDKRIFELWMACYTQKEIGEREGLTHQAVDLVLQEMAELPKIAKPIAEHLIDFDVPIYNVWKQQEKTSGSKHFGNSEPTFLDNLLYLYTKPFDIVIDPFAGGGSTIDKCRKRFRRYWVSDRKPIEERAKEIRKHDVCNGLPKISRWQDVKLVYLDPPYWKQAEGKYYDDQHIEHYAMAAKLAESILKPGRFFCCYAGKLRLPDVINAVTPYLDWIWEVCAFHPFSKEKHLGSPYQFAENWRPVLIFKKVGKAPICNFQQDAVRAERDKTFHDWQQDLKTPLQLIEAYTEPGELVVDFFCGGGTTLVAAKQSGRRWLGFDISEESVALSKRRLYGEN
jgi:hypothetical protein